MRNSTLSVAQSELIAEVTHRTYNALLLAALKSDEAHRAKLYQELKMLHPHSVISGSLRHAYDR